MLFVGQFAVTAFVVAGSRRDTVAEVGVDGQSAARHGTVWCRSASEHNDKAMMCVRRQAGDVTAQCEL